MSDIAIKVEGLSKKYIIGSGASSSLRETLNNTWHNTFRRKRIHEEVFMVLQDLNFEIKKGEAVGIIGRNGAGKSTLLKLLSKITYPTTGKITMHGRVSSLLEVGTGFHPELTGRENIYLNGTILGMTRKEVKTKFDEIVDFSGVNRFLDTPVKRYSSGMYVRLAFAVAAHLEPEILIIDEVLAVGDSEFQKKCLGKMDEVVKEGRTVLFVSHNMAAIKKLCNTGILLSENKLKYWGSIENTLEQYLNSTNISTYYQADNKNNDSKDISFNRIEVSNENGEVINEFTIEDKIRINFTFTINHLKKYNLFVIIKDQYGMPVFSAETIIIKDNYSLIIESNFLTRGLYSIHTFIHIPKIIQIDVVEDACSFSISDSTSKLSIHAEYNYGNVFGNYKWM